MSMREEQLPVALASGKPAQRLSQRAVSRSRFSPGNQESRGIFVSSSVKIGKDE